MKKRIAAVLAAVMTLGCSGIVGAKKLSVSGYSGGLESNTGWSYIGGEGHSGENALFIVNQGEGDRYIIRNSYGSSGNGHTKITFWAKGINDPKEMVNAGGAKYTDPDVAAGGSSFTVLATDGEWKKYSINTSEWCGEVKWYSDWSKTNDGFWIDDIMVYKNSTPVYIEDFETEEKVWNGWNTTNDITGYNYSSIFMAEDGNHMAVISARTSSIRFNYDFSGRGPYFKCNMKINLPVNSDGTPVKGAAKAASASDIPLSEGYAKFQEITDGSMPDMGEGRAWYYVEWDGSKTGSWRWGHENYSYIGVTAQQGYTVYVDDFYFADYGGDQRLRNSYSDDFETYYSANDFKINDFSATGSIGSVTLSWTNPVLASSEIKLYDGETEISADGIKLGANAANSIVIPVADLESHDYKIVATSGTFTAEATATAKAEKWTINNFAANGAEGRVTLTWRNPALAPTEITLYDGDTEVTTGSISLEANAINVINVATDDTLHTYKLVAKSGELTTEAVASAKAGAWVADPAADINGTPLQGWRVEKYAGNVYGGAEIVTDEVSQGEYALKVIPTVLNSDETAYQWWGGNSFQLKAYTGDIKAGQSYKLTFDGKLSYGRALRIYANWNGGQASKEMLKTNDNYSEDWKQYEFVFTPESADDRALVFSFEGGSEAFWLDNVKLYACDADGNVTGTDNLMVNGSFENELKDVKLENNVISWTQNETDDWDYVNVYLKNEDGSLTLYKKVTDATSLELGAMKNAVETFVVKTVRKGGSAEYTSKGWEVSRSAAYFVSAVSYDTVEEVETGVYEAVTEDIAALEAGLIMSSVKLSVGTLDKYSVDAYTALYNNGKLVKIQKASSTAVKGETDTLSNIIEVPALDSGVYTMKTFVWTGGTMVSEVTDAGLTE